MQTKAKTEFAAKFRNADGIEVKIAYPSAILLARGLVEQTSEGWQCVSVRERARKTYADR